MRGNAAEHAPKLLVSTAPFFRRPLREAFEAVASAGFHNVEVMVTADPATQDAESLLGLAADHGLAIEAIHAPFLLVTRRVWGTPPVGKVTRATELAAEIGCPLVVVHPPYRWQRTYRRWIDEGLDEQATATGVTIAVENMFPVRMGSERGVTFHADQQLDALERYGTLVLDTSHLGVAGIDVVEAFDRYRDRVVHLHLSNNAGKGWDSHLPVYEGVLPIGDLLERVAADRFAGTLSLELDLRAYLRDPGAVKEVLVRNREFCESRLGRAA